MCLGRRYSAQKEETVETRKGPSLRVKKGAVSGMLFPGRVSKKKKLDIQWGAHQGHAWVGMESEKVNVARLLAT